MTYWHGLGSLERKVGGEKEREGEQGNNVTKKRKDIIISCSRPRMVSGMFISTSHS